MWDFEVGLLDLEPSSNTMRLLTLEGWESFQNHVVEQPIYRLQR